MAADDFFSILLGVGCFFLLISLVGLHFNLLHGVLQVGPFCRSNHLKLKAELPLLGSTGQSLPECELGVRALSPAIRSSREAPG